MQLFLVFVFQGITNLENRKEWPLSVLRSVLQELMVETPGDLLARSVNYLVHVYKSISVDTYYENVSSYA